MKGQPKKHSAVEAVANVLIGYWIAILAQALIFPLFGFHASTRDHLLIGLLFTIVSLVRSYFLRRLFNWITVKGVP